MTHSYRASGNPFVVAATNSALRTHVVGIEQSWSGESGLPEADRVARID